LRFTLGLILVLGLVSCAAPSAAPKQHEFEVRIAATPDVNPDLEARPSPIILHLLELSAIDEFNSLSFNQLTEKDATALGGDKLNKTEIILTPGDSKQIPLVLDKRAVYLGLVAGYRDIDNATWRVSQAVVPGKTDWISVQLDKQKITIIEVNN
jgi:type VI secretion system protein VasD